MVVLGATPALAQTAPPPKAPASAATADKPPLKQEELDQLLAPVALYPDPVITQMLMASTYPLEIVEADRWLKDKGNASLKGDQLAAALEKQTWDPSVKSLISFPDVLSMMSKELDWTVKLGDAFLAQQAAVMDTIQSLRGKAKDAGNLKSTPQQNVTVEQEGSSQIIVIEPTSPQTIYVPQYNPTVVYGAWPSPAYPPYYYPTGAAIAGAAISFGVGMAMSAAWGYAWGHAAWGHGHGHGHIDMDVNRNSNFNRNINRESYRSSSTRTGGGRGNWQHDPSHRRGAAYSNRSTAQRYGGNRSANASQARDQFRGRAQQGRQDIASGRVDRSRVNQATAAQRGSRPTSTAGRGGGASRATGTSRPASTSRATGGSRGGGSFSSGATRGSGGNAFSGANRGSSTRAASSRGNSSRASAGGGGRSRSFSGGGGRSRGGGGGRRR